MKKLILLSISAVIYTSCSSQNKVFADLNKEQYEILNAFLEHSYDISASFYLNTYVIQTKYTGIFGAEYSRNLLNQKKADSICRTSKDTLTLKFSCARAFGLEKYIGLFSDKDLNYFEKKYSKDAKIGLKIDTEKLTNVLPFLSKHSPKYQENYLNKNREKPSKIK